MNLPAERENLIRSYLLGDLPQDKLEQVEEQLMTDNEFYEHLLLIEDELVDQYLGGELTDQEAGQFESHFLCSPERQQKLRFARALREYVSMQPEPAPAPIPAPAAAEPVSRWQAFLAAIQIQKPAWGYALAALIILNVSGGYWGLMRHRLLQAEYRGVQIEQEAALEQNRALQSQAGDLSQNLQRAESEREGLRQEIEDLRTGSARSAPAPGLAPQLLTPGLTRSGGRMRRIRIPTSDMGLVRLILDMATNDYDAYEVRLFTEGEEVMRRRGIQAVEDPEKIRLGFLIPAASLSPADYELQLHGIVPRGGEEIVDTYHFRAINP